jgi:hypothetical protein
MTSTTKRPSMEPRKEARAPAPPWGHKILRERALELLKSGAVAPSALLANLLAASASAALDVDALNARPRPLSSEASRLVSVAMGKLRMPGADQSSILDDLIKLAWVAKSSSPPAETGSTARAAPKASVKPKQKAGANPKGPDGRPRVKGQASKQTGAPVIVRKVARSVGEQ